MDVTFGKTAFMLRHREALLPGKLDSTTTDKHRDLKTESANSVNIILADPRPPPGLYFHRKIYSSSLCWDILVLPFTLGSLSYVGLIKQF